MALDRPSLGLNAANKVKPLHALTRVRAMLPILYEFPTDIAKDPAKWQDTANWPMVMPNIGRSMRLDSLIRDWETERSKGVKDVAIWASQHLNIEIGVGQKTDA
jgi:phage terminase large subunit-like protein